jgi:hypothetical protein
MPGVICWNCGAVGCIPEHRRVTGHNVTTTKVEKRELRDLEGSHTGTVTITATTERHIPADVNTGWRWLWLRRGWRVPPVTVDDIVHIASLAREEAARARHQGGAGQGAGRQQRRSLSMSGMRSHPFTRRW